MVSLAAFGGVCSDARPPAPSRLRHWHPLRWRSTCAQQLHRPRALQLLLLADAALYGAESSTGPAESALTTHHLFIAIGVITMLMDHFAKGVLGLTGSILTIPTQLCGGAALTGFYCPLIPT